MIAATNWTRRCSFCCTGLTDAPPSEHPMVAGYTDALASVQLDVHTEPSKENSVSPV